MASVSITDANGNVFAFPVDDKSDAIRRVSERLLSAYSRASVEKALNIWLSGNMASPLNLGEGKDAMTLKYLN